MAEYEYGSADRGRIVFEELLATYPKKSDIAHVYVDKEIKEGHYKEARSLFQRLVTHKYNMKNMKTLFKKFLDFEKRHGTQAGLEEVMEKAKQFAARIASSS